MRNSLSVLLAASLAAACNDSAGAPAPAPVQPSVRITADNAVAVAASAYRTAFSPAQAARAVTALLEIEPDEQLPAADGSRTSTFAGPDGGTAKCTWFDRDGDERYSTGDAVEVELVDFGRDGRSYSGFAFLDDLHVQGNPLTSLAWTGSTLLRFRNLRVAVGSGIDNVNGAFACTREKRATVTLVTLDPLADVRVGTATLRLGSDVARNDYVIDLTQGLFGDGTFFDPTIGGTLAFRTEIPMTGFYFLPDPATGELSVAGSDGSNLLIAPIDFFNIEIRVDGDGDGEFETIIPTEWATLAQ